MCDYENGSVYMWFFYEGQAFNILICPASDGPLVALVGQGGWTCCEIVVLQSPLRNYFLFNAVIFLSTKTKPMYGYASRQQTTEVAKSKLLILILLFMQNPIPVKIVKVPKFFV